MHDRVVRHLYVIESLSHTLVGHLHLSLGLYSDIPVTSMAR